MKMMIGENCLRTMRVVADVVPHTHDASDINSGTLPVARGGTGGSTAEAARSNLGAAAASHEHNASDINAGTLPIERGGTGADTVEGVLENLGIKQALRKTGESTFQKLMTGRFI